jgi:hypothetical protein
MIVKPPTNLDTLDWSIPSVFLAGSIEMGKAEHWQTEIGTALAADGVLVLNPRRDEWDSSWVQRMEHPLFREQVQWEISAQERADHIAMYLAPGTFAPISLLELGLFARSRRTDVCCPPDFYRRANVEIVCTRYRVPLHDHLVCMVDHIREQIGGGIGPDELEESDIPY